MRLPSLPWGYFLMIIQTIALGGMVIWMIADDRLIQQIKSDVEQWNVKEEDTPAQPAQLVNRHAEAIQHIDDDASMFLSRVSRLIMRDEGVRARPYLDPTGHVTIGVGRNLQTNGVSIAELHAIVASVDYMHILTHAQVAGGRVKVRSIESAVRLFPKPLTTDDIMLLLTDDLNMVRKQAESVFGSHWLQIDAIRREAIIDVLYNLGLPHFKAFKKFIAAVTAKKWHDAAAELLMSKAARQNITRYHRAAAVIETGDERYFELR